MSDRLADTTPSYGSVVEGLVLYVKQNERSLTDEQRGHLDEISWCLIKLQGQFARLQELNDTLAALSLPQMKFNEETEDLIVTAPTGQELLRLKLNRAHPDVPVKQNAQSWKAGYRVGSKTGSYATQGVPALRAELEATIESYYYQAFRALKMVQRLPGQKRFPYIAITMVRNDLIEHPKDTHPNNFGYGSGGPFVRPMMSTGQIAHGDKGLVANTSEFVALLQTRFPL